MGEVFLGKPWHWGLLIAVSVVLAFVGVQYLHTSAFNLFSAISLGIGLLMVCAVVLTHKQGERVTRDPIEDVRDAIDQS